MIIFLGHDKLTGHAAGCQCGLLACVSLMVLMLGEVGSDRTAWRPLLAEGPQSFPGDRQPRPGILSSYPSAERGVAVDQEQINNITESLRKAGAVLQRLGDAAKTAGRALDRYTIAEHPDLDALNLELNNLYGNSFD